MITKIGLAATVLATALFLAALAAEYQIPVASGLAFESVWGERRLTIDYGQNPLDRVAGGGCNSALEDCSAVSEDLPTRWRRWTDKYHLTFAAKPSSLPLGSDSILTIKARSFTDGAGPNLSVQVVSSSVTATPRGPFLIPTYPDSEVTKAVVLTPTSVGHKRLLLHVSVLDRDDLPAWVEEGLAIGATDRGEAVDYPTDDSHELMFFAPPTRTARVEELDYRPEEAFEIALEVFEPRFLGISDHALRIIQVVSGAIGLPALLLTLGTWVVRRRTRPPEASKIILPNSKR